MERFGELFPGAFPRVLDVGREGTNAYFDLEYIEGSISGFEFLRSNPAPEAIQSYFDALLKRMEQLHSVRRPSYTKTIDLYLYEEVERPIITCAQNREFKDFLDYKKIVFNGVEVPSLVQVLPRLYEIGICHYRNPWECYTHGNLTLENTLWVPETKQIWFVDPYEENIIDNIHNEYSQILQSCNGLYEIYNDLMPSVVGNSIVLEAPLCEGIQKFNHYFTNWLIQNLSNDDFKIVKLYEISQFSRMLPFKLHVAKDKMIFFYALASFLAFQLLEGSDA